MTSSNDLGPMPPLPNQHQPQVRPGASYGKCVLAALVWFGVVFVVLFATLGAPASGRALGLVAGRMIVPLLLSSLFTWLIFRRKPTSFGILLITSLPFFVLLSFLLGAASIAGRA
ncbi:hypothetical protein [Allokutzneria sp. NRRL B-24872]|uniref:hypothetical protein n=1 Tax=Allokutzneria sp. NRRL B-24872 TaxID=1137961 RepID=UPI000A3D3456|nr:hypothetical protein [Allokutzneria sp. NRRL B-24872]